ncbi:uncharacterized protein MYCFIDRAFT_176504 [Pseudocercospora fijiensis CIRAD86]|uniref:Uncharacterized protein n=1 Tax=Pseudocercospora fijiensis (strain CIRAD86) TaxID=383855 RepID=M3AVP5_PSEFD|nr:uncharacterized protein MYCFIDRAFT_176504 [Pseudocercospora fijiensis CIRAD86]EME81203.1 hypothetical protein MYCFIDRAFT_176504 [Pseudocercospora fijiensis CIRAD86]
MQCQGATSESRESQTYRELKLKLIMPARSCDFGQHADIIMSSKAEFEAWHSHRQPRSLLQISLGGLSFLPWVSMSRCNQTSELLWCWVPMLLCSLSYEPYQAWNGSHVAALCSPSADPALPDADLASFHVSALSDVERVVAGVRKGILVVGNLAYMHMTTIIGFGHWNHDELSSGGHVRVVGDQQDGGLALKVVILVILN